MFRFIAVCFAQTLLVSVWVANTQGVSSPQPPRRPYGVPEASLPCTPEEQAWWNEVRAAGSDLISTRRPKDKYKKRFATALHDGLTKSYSPPIADTRPVILFKTEPQYTEQARQRGVNGEVTLQLELLADGRVGDIKVIESLESGLDENSAAAARETIFLPAVKNRKFVSASVRIVMTFNIY